MSDLYIVFKVGDSTYAIPGSDVLQLETFAGATRVPGTPPHVTGLVQLRSHLVPVVDLRIRFGLEPITPTLDSRIVVVRREDRHVGLLVDAAREVTRIDPKDVEPPPEAVLRQSDGFVRAMARSEGRILMLIDVDRVIGSEDIHGQPHVHQG